MDSQEDSFSLRKTIGGIPVSIVQFDWSRFAEAYQLMLLAAKTGDGFSTDEAREEEFRKRLGAPGVYMVIDESRDKLAAVVGYSPSLLCRSYNPMCCGGFYIVDKAYRGIGLPLELNYSLNPYVILNGNYLASSARINVGNKNILIALSMGVHIYAVIPKSMRSPDGGLIDNVVTWYDWSQSIPDSEVRMKALFENKNISPLAIDKSKAVPSWLHKPSGLHRTPKQITNKIKVRDAKVEEVFEVDDLLRLQALNGAGFGVDEFTPEGYHSRRMLSETSVLVLETGDGEMAGCALFGPSKLARNRDLAAGCYIVIKEPFRNQGIATRLVEYLSEKARELGFHGFLVDVLMTANKDHVMNVFLNNGFKTTGTLGYCAFVKDKGPTDSVIMFKHLSTNHFFPKL